MKLMEKELKMTMGCTDPGAVAYGTAVAAYKLEEEVKEISVRLSKGLYKNAFFVGIPHIKASGIHYAALLGSIIKKPEKKLQVLSGINYDTIEVFKRKLNEIKINVDYICDSPTLYLEAVCVGEKSTTKVIIKDDYDNIQEIYKDDKLVYINGNSSNNAEDKITMNLKEIYDYCMSFGNEEEEKLLHYENINRQVIDSNKNLKDIDNSCKEEALVRIAREYTFEACRKRMSGEPVPVLSLCGSGNLGLTSMLSVSGVCDVLKVSKDKRAKALALSMLIAIYIKASMNRVTVVCGTALAGAAGCSAATVYLLGGGYEEIVHAINSVITTTFGILCDGAKDSCAFKTSFSVSNGIVSALQVMKGNIIGINKGIVSGEIDTTIFNIGSINNNAMSDVENSILELIKKA